MNVLSTNHGVDWVKYKNPNNLPINGRVKKIKWGIRLPTGEKLLQGGDVQNKFYTMDYFCFSFPINQIEITICETNRELARKRKKETSLKEIYKLFGMMILITRFEFTSRSRLWSFIAQNKYIPAPRLGSLTGMSRQRFNNLWACLCWSHQPIARPNSMSHSQHRWMLVDDMISIFNQHRKDHFIPSKWLCCDKSILRWYGLGGGGVGST